MTSGSWARSCRRGLSAVLALLMMIGAVAQVSGTVLASPAPRYTIEIRPEMELLAGVLAQTDWIINRGPRGEGNDYYRALKAYLEPYKDHQAIQIAQQLTKKRFTYDAPPATICHFGPLPELELKYEYSDYLLKRAGGREILEDFRLALKDLAEKSKFQEFIAQWQGEMDAWVRAAQVDGDRMMEWLEGFFGAEMQESHILLAPAMFPGGGYGVTAVDRNGKSIAFQIVREDGYSTTKPQFQGGSSLNDLTLHEWGHSFVNPTLAKHEREIDQLNYLFLPVAIPMLRQAYGGVAVFMNEQVLRAVTSLAAEEMGGSAALEREIVYNEERSFYLTRDLVAILREYQSARDRYPTFEVFTPVMVQRLMEMHPPQFWQRWLTERNLIAAAAVIAILITFLLARVVWMLLKRVLAGRSIPR